MGLWRDISLSNIIKLIIEQSFWDPQTHKEERFMIGGLVMMMILISISIPLLVELVILPLNSKDLISKFPRLRKQNIPEIKYWIKTSIVVLLVIFLLFQSFQKSKTRYHEEQFNDVNDALIEIGHRKDVIGVIILNQWYESGSYFYLHKNNSVAIANIDFRTNDPTAYSVSKQVFSADIKKTSKYNYVVFPRYQIYFYSGITDKLIDAGYRIDSVIDGRTEIWKLMEN